MQIAVCTEPTCIWVDMVFPNSLVHNFIYMFILPSPSFLVTAVHATQTPRHLSIQYFTHSNLEYLFDCLCMVTSVFSKTEKLKSSYDKKL